MVDPKLVNLMERLKVVLGPLSRMDGHHMADRLAQVYDDFGKYEDESGFQRYNVQQISYILSDFEGLLEDLNEKVAGFKAFAKWLDKQK